MPSAPSASSTMKPGVRSLPPRGCGFACASMSAPALIFVIAATVAEHHGAEQRVERDRTGEAFVETVLHALLGLRDGLFLVEPEAELLEVDVREVEHLCPAELLLPVDLRDVLVGMILEAAMRLVEEIGVFAVDHRFARADLGARGLLAGGDAVV